jgi:hypothetical protein
MWQKVFKLSMKCGDFSIHDEKKDLEGIRIRNEIRRSNQDLTSWAARVEKGEILHKVYHGILIMLHEN